jgi:hypothetical protein
MAFDTMTRGSLHGFVADARSLLMGEFTAQFQQDYGLDPESGLVADLSSLAHLDDQRLETARILREILDHYVASSIGRGTEVTKAALDRMVREQAFTTLNRLAALRMMESRGLIMEAVARGYQSKAFQLYQRVAGTALGETGDTYRTFLNSMFDLYGVDLPALFDRHYPNGRLFPREPALLPLLDLLNAADIDPLWAEDETIGWIYQYFNSKEERKAMRDASPAPRNSRELAIRNQFFTPRYVVEFLVDNTLGRLWFNWTGGWTGLRDRCQYLLVQPVEIPEPARRLRDPRTIKLLDPACGSMHFGLYAFDLFLEIYREAWAWEQTHGPGCLDSETGGSPDLRPLCLTYEDEAAFLRDVPRLVIEHNIYGVDIDPRAAQIASLALWLRAQRAWHEAGVNARARPQVGQGQVIAAVAPPAEVELRKSFMANLDNLDALLFEKTLFLLKGLPELGILLQIEKELPKLIHLVFGEHGALFKEEDVVQWQNAESRLQEALNEFTDAAKSTYQDQLFAHDALQGLRLIDLCREKFDVVVMNPPFGQGTKGYESYYKENYRETSSDELAAAFFSRAVSLMKVGGLIGEISSRTIFYIFSLKEWRKNVLFEKAPLRIFLDIGGGELDDAVNETAVYIAETDGDVREPCYFGMFHKDKDKPSALRQFSDLERPDATYVRPIGDFTVLDDRPLCYWVSSSFLDHLKTLPAFGDEIAEVQMGLAPRDEFRYSRLWWEVQPQNVGKGRKWVGYAKGGELSPYFSDIDLLLNAEDNMREIKADLNKKYPYLKGNLDWVLHPENSYFEPGLTFGQRTTFLRVSVLPSGCYFSVAGKAIFGKSQRNAALLQAVNTPSAQYLMYLRRERLDMDPQFQEGDVARMPWPRVGLDEQTKLAEFARECTRAVANVLSFDETTHIFCSPCDFQLFGNARREAVDIIAENERKADEILARLLSYADDDLKFIRQEIIPKWHFRSVANWYDYCRGADEISFLVGAAVGRWDIRFVTMEKQKVEMDDLFSPPPASSPAMLQGEMGLPAQPADLAADYPLQIAWQGILVDEEGHEYDIVERIHSVATRIWPQRAVELEQGFCNAIGEKTTRDYIRRPSNFFAAHLKQYSKNGRRAPIYWPISVESNSYTLWLYYPRITGETLYTVVNDFLEPKLKHVRQERIALLSKAIGAHGRNDVKILEALETLEKELIELRDTLLQIASTYRPNHDDGVQITAAPLWRLFRHKPWQKLLKETWTKLERGDYDWAHLALAYWPDRVREKCKTDKSLAIAHNLEHLYVELEAAPAKARGRKKGADA